MSLSEEDKAAGWPAPTCCARPSLHGESFGMVLLEGMAAGCAVVASDIEGYRVAAGGHAALVPPSDPAALARALGVALADAVAGSGRSAPEALQQAAREHARDWSMDTLAERYVGLYARRHRRPPDRRTGRLTSGVSRRRPIPRAPPTRGTRQAAADPQRV